MSYSLEEVLSKNAQQYPLLREFVAMKPILKKSIVLVKRLLAVVCLTSPAIGFSEVSILALGDSLTQGYGLAQQDGFVPQLNKWLLDQGNDARVAKRKSLPLQKKKRKTSAQRNMKKNTLLRRSYVALVPL